MDGLPLWRSGDHVLALDAVRVGPSTPSSRAKRGDPGAAAAALRSSGSPRRFAPRDDDSVKARRALGSAWRRSLPSSNEPPYLPNVRLTTIITQPLPAVGMRSWRAPFGVWLTGIPARSAMTFPSLSRSARTALHGREVGKICTVEVSQLCPWVGAASRTAAACGAILFG